MDFYSILKDECIKSGISPTALLKELNISTSKLTAWKKGSMPNSEFLIPISERLNVSIDYLLTGKEKSNIQSKNISNTTLTEAENELLNYFRKLPVQEKGRLIGRAEILAEQAEAAICTEHPMIKCRHSLYKVSAGTGYGLDEGDAWQDEIEIPDTPTNRKADLCITIKGNSMEPVYMDGDIVLVKSQKSIDLGQIGIFNVGGKGYIKKYGRDRLISLNEDCDDIMFSDHEYDNIECVGIVLGRI